MDRLNAREITLWVAALLCISVPAGSSSSTLGVSPAEDEVVEPPSQLPGTVAGSLPMAQRGGRFLVVKVAVPDSMVARSLNGSAAYLDLAGCRAPESPFGAPAVAALSALVQNQTVEVISRHVTATNRDEPARRQVTAFVPTGSGKVLDICAELIAEGLSLPQTGGALPAEAEARYLRLATEARAARIGLWSDPQAPRFATGLPLSAPLVSADLRRPASGPGVTPTPDEGGRCTAADEERRPGTWNGP